MGGKSVALKTIALNTLLALCGMYTFAENAIVSLLDNIYIISEDLESIDSGLSSFGGEILEFNRISKKINDKSLLIMDEFARGTNPDEGAAIVKATTQWLQNKDAFSVLSTHYDNVAELAGAHYQVIGLKDIDLISLKSELAVIEVNKGVDRIADHMNYGLYKVVGKQNCPKDALNICKLLDLDPDIVQLAENYY
jgi:DNA mismatch repair ATPase MutS